METALLPDDLTINLKALSKSENVTMFVLTLACFGILLNRFTGQSDIVIGSPVANRGTETEPLIGPFAGPFALRLNLSGNPTFREVLARVREATYDALTHTELPFEVLLESLKVRSVHGRNPLFQFYFFYQTAFLQPRQLKQLTVTPMPTFSVGTPFEIQLGFVERSEGLRAQVEYNPNLFDASTIQQTIHYYETVLRALIANPNQRIEELPSPAKKVSPAPANPVSATQERVAPRDNLETTLAQIWQEILDQPRISVRDDFFELGGHSLLAAKLLTRIEHGFGKELPLASLLDASTIEKQARLIRGEKADSLNPSAVRSGQVPLFYLGGDPTFRPLSQKLSELHEFHSLGMQASFVRGLA
jgi:non-ribosomal peptide synthetase component F